MAEPVNQPPTPQPSTSHAAEAVAAGETTQRRNDDRYAPTLFYGKSNENAETYVAYIERYQVYKHLSDDEVLELLPVLLRDAASDFYESLTVDQKTSWTAVKDTFLQRFGRSAAQRWKDANMLWSETQGDMNVDDYVTKVTTHQPRQTSTGPRRIDATSRVNPRSEATHPQLRPAGRRQNDGRSTARRQSRRDGIVRCRHRSIKAMEELRESNKQQLTAFQQLSDRIHGKSAKKRASSAKPTPKCKTHSQCVHY